MQIPSLPDLPLSQLKEQFITALQQTPLLLEAEPGAGKSTLAPLWVLANTSTNKQVWLIQPRVLAAQALAQRLADLLNEKCGETIGYQVPYDARTSDQTRLVLMTPGILLQHLLQNPTLDDVACVMLDEIHERSVNQDLAWALLQEVQILRDDLQLVLMSATPDPALQQQISNRLFASGRCFPVTVDYQPARQVANQFPEKIEEHLIRVLRNYPHWQQHTVLVFLPGWREIEDCAQTIARGYPTQSVFRLHSRIAAQEQHNALDPAQGARIILATNIAETSLTIADVTLVIDSGLARRVDYEQRTGIARLRTARISMASAEQRRGRAGRVQAGHCIRLWSQDLVLAAADLPEIRATDYLPLALRIAHWGSPADSLPWLEKPNRLALEYAQQQLQQMQLVNSANVITNTGSRVSELGTHPRIAAFLLLHQQTISDSSLLLALALHFELPAEHDMDELLAHSAHELARNRQWQQQQKRWVKALQLQIIPAEIHADFLATAFSDRIGYRQESGKYRLNSGISVESSLNSQWVVFPIINTRPKSHSGVGVRVQLSEVLQRQLSQQQSQLEYKQHCWQRRTVWRMGGVIIDEQYSPLNDNEIPACLLEHIQHRWREKGMQDFNWNEKALRLLERARLVRKYQMIDLPALENDALYAALPEWLLPFLNKSTHLEHLPWEQGLEFYLGYDNCQLMYKLLPEKIELPSGRHVAVEFNHEGHAQVSAKLQEFFGCEQLQLADGKIPLQIHLLSPNGSPLAITTNLRTFWQQAYPEVRKEMRGRYPRHPWPDNPLEHEATALTKRKLAMTQKPDL